MSNVVEFRAHQIISHIDRIVKEQRHNIKTVYDIVAPMGFKTRMKTPISKMNFEQLDKLNEQMLAWVYDNKQEVAI